MLLAPFLKSLEIKKGATLLNRHVQQADVQNFGYSVLCKFAAFSLSKRAPPIFKKGATIHCGDKTLYFTSSNLGDREKAGEEINGNIIVFSGSKKPGKPDPVGVSADGIKSGLYVWR